MSRFEIEDIVSQDNRGIIFLAKDSENGGSVALRRFFPFGQDGGGLVEEETIAFRLAAQRFAGVTHPALRAIYSGDIDPIDSMPYIVAEWVDGTYLGDALNGETLDPKRVIRVLQLALEVSLFLSEILGVESVWVETDKDTIFVGSEKDSRDFVFWLSPFKWLGAEFETRKLASLVELGEQLAGWKGKLIRDQSGHGLGGWLKWMKNNPDATLTQALELLPTPAIAPDTELPPKPSLVSPITSHPVVSLKKESSISPLMIVAGIGILLALGGLCFKLMTKAPVLAPEHAEQTISPSKTDRTPNEIENISHSPAVVVSSSVRDFYPGDGEKMRELKSNSPVSVTGVLQQIRHSSTGLSMYFEFSSPLETQEISAVAHRKSYEGAYDPREYAELIGKTLRFEGIVMREPSGRQLVKILSSDKISEKK